MPHKVLWTEGLFMTQHHLQLLDGYHERQLDERMRGAVPHAFGVTELAIDERSLADGLFQVQRLAAVFPGGAVVRAGSGGDTIPARRFDAAFHPQLPALDVYVGLPIASDDDANTDVEATTRITRYRRAQESVRDFNTGAGEHPVDVAKPNLQVLFGDERRDAFECLRIARLVRGAGGRVSLGDACVPPVLQLGASPFLLKGFGALLAAMTARHRALADSRRQRSASAVEFAAGDVAKFGLLLTLSGYIPIFAHYVDGRTARPEQAYLTLAQLIGQLGTFAAEGDLSAVPKFEHADLGAVFEPMFAQAMTLVGATIRDRCEEIPLVRQADGVLRGELGKTAPARAAFYLGVTSTLPEMQLRERLPRLMKIASGGQIHALVNSAVTGVPVELDYRPPSALPIKPGLTWFRLARNSDYWPDIAATATFAIYHPFDPQTVSVSLYAVDGDDVR